MRFGLGLAICVSVLLISVASWTRFGQAQETQPGLVSVSNPVENSDDYYKQVADAFLGGSNSTTSTKELTGTDIIGRQLIFDYVELAASGQASEETINQLADQYVESIPTLIQAPKINAFDLNVVSNTLINLQAYENEGTNILKDYEKKISSIYSTGINVSSPDAETYKFALSASLIYNQTANNLKNLQVPAAIAPSHLKLVNYYLANAAAMKAVSEVETDSSKAFAGLIYFNTGLEEETSILKEINQIFSNYGL